MTSVLAPAYNRHTNRQNPSNVAVFTLSDGREVVATIKMMTPDEAQQLLALNTNNRPLNRRAADQIASDIIDGEWKFTGDTIKIAVRADGTRFIADAQHRLEAIVKGGVPVEVLVVENLDPEVTDIIDQGKPRNVGDILRMTYGRSQFKNESIIGGIAVLLMRGNNQNDTTNQPPRKEVAAYCHQNFVMLDEWASWAKLVSSQAPKVQYAKSLHSAMAASPLGALAIHMCDSGADTDLVTEFFERIATGVISESDHTNIIQAMRRRQANTMPLTRPKGGGYHVLLFTEFAVYISAFNKWIAGEQVSVFKGQKVPIRNFFELPQVTKSVSAD